MAWLDCFIRDLKQVSSRKIENKKPDRETKEHTLLTSGTYDILKKDKNNTRKIIDREDFLKK